jgi:hypothetical protein
MNTIFKILSIDNTISVNRTLAHVIGLQESVFYQALLSKNEYYEKRNLLDPDGYFYCTFDDMEKSTTLPRRAQERIVAKLVELNLISYCRKGMPAKRFFAINKDESVLLSILKQDTDNNLAENPDDSEDASSPEDEIIPEDADESAVCTKRTNKIVRNVQTSLPETYKQDCTERTNKIVQNVQTSLYETSKQDSTERTNKIVRNVQEIYKDKSIKDFVSKELPGDVAECSGSERRLSYKQLIQSKTDNLKLQNALLEYVKMRMMRHNSPTNEALSMLIDDLAQLSTDADEQVKIVLQSVKGGWPCFYKLGTKVPGRVKNQFNDFQQNKYDFDGLEKDILKN